MSDPDPFASIFRGQDAAISALRERDENFDELCADYEELHDRIPLAARSHLDELESLRALEQEIREWLSNHEPPIE